MSVVRQHPYLTAAFVLGAVVGAVAGVFLFDPDTWSMARRVVAGALMGVICTLILTASRIIAPAEE